MSLFSFAAFARESGDRGRLLRFRVDGEFLVAFDPSEGFSLSRWHIDGSAPKPGFATVPTYSPDAYRLTDLVLTCADEGCDVVFGTSVTNDGLRLISATLRHSSGMSVNGQDMYFVRTAFFAMDDPDLPIRGGNVRLV